MERSHEELPLALGSAVHRQTVHPPLTTPDKTSERPLIGVPLVLSPWVDDEALSIEDVVEEPHPPPPVSLSQHLTLPPPLLAEPSVSVHFPVQSLFQQSLITGQSSEVVGVFGPAHLTLRDLLPQLPGEEAEVVLGELDLKCQPWTWCVYDLLLDGPCLPWPHLKLVQQSIEVVAVAKLPQGRQYLLFHHLGPEPQSGGHGAYSEVVGRDVKGREEVHLCLPVALASP